MMRHRSGILCELRCSTPDVTSRVLLPNLEISIGSASNTHPDRVRRKCQPMRVQAGSGFDDMQLLKKIVSDVDGLLFVAKTYRRPN